MIPITGYTDKLSGRPGDTLSFMVSSNSEQPYDVQLMRIICADPNPDGPGIIEEEVDSSINGSYPSRIQSFRAGSYAIVEAPKVTLADRNFSLSVSIYPTLLSAKKQIILEIGNATLFINEKGCLTGRIGSAEVTLDKPLHPNRWYLDVQMSYDVQSNQLTLSHADADSSTRSTSITVNNDQTHFEPSAVITIAAGLKENLPVSYFNGKIESPKITVYSDSGSESVLAAWDFSRGISSTEIIDTGPNSLNGNLINFPTRGVTGFSWDGGEMCWRHAPDQYAAIHFHDDDIYDFNWLPDFSLKVPESLPSGIYAARIRCGEFVDYLPFFICPPKGKATADLCVLISTFTYVIYGNHARPDFGPDWQQKTANWNAYPWNPAQHREYGLSTYNIHSDGSGICHASHRRPLLNLRPGFLTFNYGTDSGLRHFQADSHLIAWLHAMNYDYDIVTDEELQSDGVEAIAGYKVVTTGTHPEYHTEQTLDALTHYRNQGGRFMYLGGNGFYWRIARHKDEFGVIEIRRGEGGIRAWASEPGEYYNAFDGAYGGLWRRNARPPQQLTGIGFSAQGEFYGSYYRRKTGSDTPPSASWAFEGIDEELLGDFGFSGGGAAGFELDRVDHRLGSPDDIQILASSEVHNDGFILVPEEQLTHITNLPGEPADKLLRADMVYFQVAGGGEVFATGSITFCGSLPYNNFDNNISHLLKNVTDRFLR